VQKKFQFHVIPNTHWDREWLYNFQETRMFLIEFMDKLLDIFERFPEYKTYLLDSQTIPIEDYLEIRPEKEAEVRKRVQEKRLFIGPWYTLPEEHLVNGESLVRNLLLGHQLAEKYGSVMKVGYSPFSYGQASQMPQIYHGFGIDTILFYHGITPDESRSEFIFEGPDGSQLFASRMGSNARYNFFFSIYRPLIFGKEILEREYKWEEGGLPFHLCGENNYLEHHFLVDPVKHFYQENLSSLFEKFKQTEKEHCTSEHIACMQGMDSTQPDEVELKTTSEALKVLKDDKIFHSSLPDWINAAKKSVDKKDLIVLKGERRTPRNLGTRVHLYGDVTSARTRLKRKNALAELELQRKAEPFAVLSNLLGSEYPKVLLEKSWKYLLQCHPHDSIAGTGIDQIEKDMHHRLDQSRNISAGLCRRSLQTIQKRIDNSDVEKKHVILTVFNPSPFPRSEIVTAILDLPGFKQYGIWEAESDNETEYQELCRYEHRPVIRHLGDATMQMSALRIHIHLPVTNIPALGYTTFIIKEKDDFKRLDGSLNTSPNTMENEFLKVTINPNGTFDFLQKETGQLFKGLHYFEDSGEAGHAWRHVPPAFDRRITTLNSSPTIELAQLGPFLTSYIVTHKMEIPAKLAEGTGDYVRRLDAEGDDASRSGETNELFIKSVLTLRKQARGIEVKTTFNNNCEDHRLRIMFPTHLDATHSYAEEPFDVVERPINRGPDSPWKNTWNPTHPQQRFVDVSDEKNGLAIINDGLREYEVTDDETRTIGITLLRAFEVALTTVAWKWERHPEMKLSQSLGENEFRYFIYPHSGDWDMGKVMQQADRFTLPLELAQAGSHSGDLPKTTGFFELAPNDLVLTGMKKAEGRESIIIRIYNPTKREINGKMKFNFKFSKARFTNLNEEPIENKSLEIINNEIFLNIEKKKIYTIELINAEFGG
jgi:mannosylglycerate hydrolase